MADKALISELTHRSLEMQKDAFRGMPMWTAPDEITDLLRPTSRKETDIIHVLSLGVIAEREKDFRQFLSLLRKRGAELHAKEEDIKYFGSAKSIQWLVAQWKGARVNGVRKIGGKISADLRKADSKAACDKIKDRWGMPSKIWPTKVLLKEAGIVYNTARKELGSRPIAQYNYQAALKRKARRQEAKEG